MHFIIILLLVHSDSLTNIYLMSSKSAPKSPEPDSVDTKSSGGVIRGWRVVQGIDYKSDDRSKRRRKPYLVAVTRESSAHSRFLNRHYANLAE